MHVCVCVCARQILTLGLLCSTEQTDGNRDLRELAMEEVRKAEKRLKNGKTGGDDGIVAGK